MSAHAPHRRRLGAAAVVAALLLAGLAPAATAAPSGPDAPVPTRMAALGDSITRGFHTSCGFLQDCPAQSWTTGTSTSFDSHYERMAAIDPVLTGADNLAVTGADSSDLAGQAAKVSSDTGYVTVLVGANDACTDTVAQMTPTATFAANVDAAFDTLEGLPTKPRVLVASIPDLYRLWDVGRTSGTVRFTWTLYGICQSMLANPRSTTTTDEQRRQTVRQRVIDYNAALAQRCAAYGELCRYDGGAVFGYPFALSQLSTLDYFHPNVAGQAVLAETTWNAGFAWTKGSQPPPPPPGEPTLSVSELTGSSTKKGKAYEVTVTVTVTDQESNPYAGATAAGAWSGDVTWSCTTGTDGTCSTKTRVSSLPVVFTVTDVTAPGATSWSGKISVTVS